MQKTYMCIYRWRCAYTYIYIHMHMLHTCTYGYINMYMCVYKMHNCVCICTCIHMDTCTCIHIGPNTEKPQESRRVLRLTRLVLRDRGSRCRGKLLKTKKQKRLIWTTTASWRQLQGFGTVEDVDVLKGKLSQSPRVIRLHRRRAEHIHCWQTHEPNGPYKNLIRCVETARPKLQIFLQNTARFAFRTHFARKPQAKPSHTHLLSGGPDGLPAKRQRRVSTICKQPPM